MAEINSKMFLGLSCGRQKSDGSITKAEKGDWAIDELGVNLSLVETPRTTLARGVLEHIRQQLLSDDEEDRRESSSMSGADSTSFRGSQLNTTDRSSLSNTLSHSPQSLAPQCVGFSFAGPSNECATSTEECMEWTIVGPSKNITNCAASFRICEDGREQEVATWSAFGDQDEANGDQIGSVPNKLMERPAHLSLQNFLSDIINCDGSWPMDVSRQEGTSTAAPTAQFHKSMSTGCRSRSPLPYLALHSPSSDVAASSNLFGDEINMVEDFKSSSVVSLDVNNADDMCSMFLKDVGSSLSPFDNAEEAALAYDTGIGAKPHPDVASTLFVLSFLNTGFSLHAVELHTR